MLDLELDTSGESSNATEKVSVIAQTPHRIARAQAVSDKAVCKYGASVKFQIFQNPKFENVLHFLPNRVVLTMATTTTASTKRKASPDNPKVVTYECILSPYDDHVWTCQFCRMQGSYVEVTTSGPQHNNHTETAVTGTPCPRYDPDKAVQVLSALEKEYRVKQEAIRKNAEEAIEQILEQIEKDKRRQLNDALQAYKTRKARLLKSSPTDSKKCSICQASMAIPAGKCIEENCSNIVCKTCLDTKIEDHVKCDCCNEIKNFVCTSCVERKSRKGWYQFDFCRQDCGFICPEHVGRMQCCVCGSCTLCNGPGRQCSIDTCERCGDYLCDRCRSKEGCMCES
jgi:hypothetical protein